MNILIAGGGGFLGKFLIKRFLMDKNQVTVLDLGICKESVEQLGCEFIDCDISSPLPVELGKNYDTAIFLSQSPFYRQLPEKASLVIAVNVAGLTTFTELARLHGVKHLLYASSGNVYAPSLAKLSENSDIKPSNIYGLSKKIGEDILEYYKPYFKITSLRYFCIYGPNQKNMLIPNLIERVRNGQQITLDRTENEDAAGTGGFKITPTFVKDVADVMSHLIQNTIEGCFNVSGTEELSIRQLAETIGEKIGKEPIFQVTDNLRTGDLLADNSKLISVYKKKFTSFADGIKEI
ncbi:MAG: NAD(P)-dependent oxidoreductase [Bacillota bacterium]|nr:NAD(P)-dependent oxidoreductase [Bacillota bacterium]